MELGVCKITIIDKNIKHTFSPDFVQKLNDLQFEKKLKKSALPTSSFWRRDSKQTQFIKNS
jgi:hypothetical protein